MDTSLWSPLVEVLSLLAGRDFTRDTELYWTANLIDCYHSPSLVRLARLQNISVNILYDRFTPLWSFCPVSIGPNGFLHFRHSEKLPATTPLPVVEAGIIGKVSCASFSQKWGTPRQGQLAPHSRCVVEVPLEKIPPPSQYVGVLWVPHLSQSKNPLQTLVRPPKAHGNFKSGVFATRSPHRPSPVCLSIAKIDQIDISDRATLHLSGCDMTEGTPVLSIFPYCQNLHAVAGTKTPRWVREANTVTVVWGLGGVFDLQTLFDEDDARTRLQALVTATLKQDPRSKHSKKQLNQPVHAFKLETGNRLIAVTYQHVADDLVRVLRLNVTDELGKLRTKEWLSDTLAKMPFLLA